mmetsp:Transcript_24586/g.60414  ORF Transcript_24586/g.60414 Transcript_24586/m.60414 type:complete len:82 (-) Transcript_24586:183-428(-)
MPAVEKNRDGLAAVIARITEQCDLKKAKVDDMQKRYKIHVKGGEQQDDEGESAGGSSSQGVIGYMCRAWCVRLLFLVSICL